MDATVEQFPPYRGDDDHGQDDRAHHDPGFCAAAFFSTDHKIIGIQYGFTALCFMLFGFFLMLLMRWQIAHPGQPVPFIGPLLEKVRPAMAGNGAISAVFTTRSAGARGPSWRSSTA